MWFMALFVLAPLLALSLALSLAFWSDNTSRRVDSGPGWPDRGVLMSGTRLKAYLASGQIDDSIRSVDFRNMRRSGRRSEYISLADHSDSANDVQKVILQFPNLEAVQFRDEQIRNMKGDILRRLKNVHSVSISPVTVTTEDLKQLALLPSLQHLQISSPHSAVDLQGLRHCQALRSIEVDSGYVQQDSQSDGEPVCSIAGIAQLASIPGLRVLTISYGPILGDSNSTHGLLTEGQRSQVTTLANDLAQSSHLDRLFIGTGHGDGSLETVRMLRKRLPQMTVLPAMYAQSRVKFLSNVMMPIAMVVALIVTQATGQLSGPQSLLIPGYRKEHLKVVGIVYGILVVEAVFGAWSAGIAWFVAPGLILILSAVLMGIVTGIWSGGATSPSRPNTWVSRTLGWIYVVFLGSLFLLPIGVQRLSPWANWFLAGEQPWAALVLTAFGSAILYYSFNRLYQSHRLRTEAGIPQAVTGQEVGMTPQYAAAHNASGSNATRRQARWSRNVANCVVSLKNGATGWQAIWSQSQLWLLGSVGYSLLLGLITVWVVTVAVGLRDITNLEPATLARRILELPSLSTALQVIPIFIGMLTWQRRSLVAGELLRSVSRTQWVNITLGTVWWLNVQFLGVTWLIVLLLRLVAGIPAIGTWTITECLAVLGGATISAGLLVWAAGVNRIWIAVTGVFAAAFSSTIVAEVILPRHANNAFTAALSDPYVAIGCACGALLVGLAIMASARRYWLRLELAPSAD